MRWNWWYIRIIASKCQLWTTFLSSELCIQIRERMKMRLGVKSEFIIPVLSLSYQVIIFWSQLYWSQEGLEDIRSSWERQPLLAHAKQIIVTALANKDCHCLLVLQKTFKWLLSKFFPKYTESWLKVIFNKKKVWWTYQPVSRKTNRMRTKKKLRLESQGISRCVISSSESHSSQKHHQQ